MIVEEQIPKSMRMPSNFIIVLKVEMMMKTDRGEVSLKQGETALIDHWFIAIITLQKGKESTSSLPAIIFSNR